MKDVADDYASNLRMTKDFLQAKLDIDAKEAIVNGKIVRRQVTHFIATNTTYADSYLRYTS